MREEGGEDFGVAISGDFRLVIVCDTSSEVPIGQCRYFPWGTDMVKVFGG